MSAAVVLLVVGAVCLWPHGGRCLVALGDHGEESGGLMGRALAAARELRERRDSDDLGELAAVAESIAMAMRAGATPERAVAVARRQASGRWGVVLDELWRSLADGHDVSPVWSRVARERPEAAFLSGAWSLSERLGSPLAPTMSTAAEVMRGRLAVQRRVDAASSGPRATMMMLTLLPVAGLCAGLAFGVPPWEVVSHSRVTMASVAMGLVLTCVGWWLCRTVLARSLRERVWR